MLWRRFNSVEHQHVTHDLGLDSSVGPGLVHRGLAGEKLERR
jgi:hypothetical protein